MKLSSFLRTKQAPLKDILEIDAKTCVHEVKPTYKTANLAKDCKKCLKVGCEGSEGSESLHGN